MNSRPFFDDVYRPILSTNERDPKSVVKSYPHWVQLTTPNIPVWYFNVIKHSELLESETNEAIVKTIHHYKTHGLGSFSWIVGPKSLPHNLDEILPAHGFTKDCKTIAMAIAPDVFEIRGSSEFVCKNLSIENFEDLLQLEKETWGASENILESMRRDREDICSKESENLGTILCYKNGKPVGSAAYIIYDNLSLHLLGGGVAPHDRGHGAYRALVEHRIAVARRRHIPVVTVHCLESTSAPICKKFGFQPVCEFIKFDKSLK